MEDDPQGAGREAFASTQYGQIKGSWGEGIRTFLGVPYAAPPTPFELPQPPATWSGIRDALVPGDCAPHAITPFPGLDIAPLVGHGGIEGRDYLTLNVWAPEEAAGRPVMVFVHGGGFVIGSKDAAVHDGSAFARSGVVCVAINYRLGIDGFLPVPGAPTNLGLRDILFALRWVQDNIANFGGDPANVTLFGESAGAMAIADLITSPLAKGLFQRAIVESGHGSMVREIPIAQRLVAKLAKVLKVPATVEGFRGVSVADGLSAMAKIGRRFSRLDLRDAAGHEPVFGISRFVPVIGDDVLPVHPLAALRAGAGAEIDLLIGTNSEEMNLYFVPTGVRAKLGRLLAAWVLGKSNPQPRAVLRAYGLGTKGASVGEAFTRAMTDLVFRWPARQYAAAHAGRSWAYEFDWHSPACGGELGACHGMELPFVFKTLPTVTGTQGLAGTAPPQELADRVHALWVGFATDGALPWKPFNACDRLVYQLDKGDVVHEPVMPAARFLPE
ncbi:carboxylesterase/lipase family protein [Novosphingobium sp. JCM 18896]|uniref:carboxylesterase/lipase family protein n=1 Tax=Novosphingobium sp. JCM 18896 TaxID=2989731 RepID=UPI0022225ECB|nr:carboxylesterase family protein [Novosphingobium sp. JCM 18896]MCW1429817.1 carboxylesterase family protein [Novosphingobium sp. JCM 18896]